MHSRPPAGAIRIIGADANNLRCVDTTLPTPGMTVVTGVSGSGKSSLLAATLGAEGARRSRLFFDVPQPEWEGTGGRAFIDPLPPTVLVGQRGFRPSIRTTVATASGVMAAVRRLFLSFSAPFAADVGEFVPPPSAEIYASWLARHYRGEAEIWAAPVRRERTDGVAAARRLQKAGLDHWRIYSETDPPRLAESGRIVGARDFRPLNPGVWHTIEACVATLKVRGAADEAILCSAFRTAFEAGGGSVTVMLPQCSESDLDGPFGPRLDSRSDWVHPVSPRIFRPPTPHLLSFNAPQHPDSGACRACQGTGKAAQLRLDELVTRPELSMSEGAFTLWTPKNYKHVSIQHDTIRGLSGLRGFFPDVPWEDLPEDARRLVIDGAGDTLIHDIDAKGRKLGAPRPFKGFGPAILQKAAGNSKSAEVLGALIADGPCSVCAGTRWSPQARALRVGDRGLADLLALPVADLEALAAAEGEWVHSLPPGARPLVSTLHRHCEALRLVGVGYISGERGMLEVSGGESRRVRLARVMNAGGAGFCLLLDEPARGLHEADIGPLAEALDRLRARHMIVVNEHRRQLWSLADLFLEMGPGGGPDGGTIVGSGKAPPVTPPAKTKRLRQPCAVTRKDDWLKVKGARLHNLAGVDCSIPLGRICCICGVSGSGKSSFVRGILAPALASGEQLEDFAVQGGGRWTSIVGRSEAGRLIALDQVVPTANRRSLVASRVGLFEGLRRAFGRSEGAAAEGLTPTDFGINAGKGRCLSCFGTGTRSELVDDGPCPICGGSRYGPGALGVRVAGRNIAEVLALPAEALVSTAAEFGISEAVVNAMVALDLGHLSLGRRVDSLSGGEFQRLRLAERLAAASDRPGFVILDEPAAGLHGRDVEALIRALDRLTADGRNTVLVVDHDLEIIRNADWTIEFGPGAGPQGGRILFEGTPSDLAGTASPTGEALRGELPARRLHRVARGASHVAAALERSERTRQLLRTLVSGDAPPEEVPPDDFTLPAATLEPRMVEGFDVWEVGGLDIEIPKLLLDLHASAHAADGDELLAAWQEDSRALLCVNPFLAEISIWGERLPLSDLRAASRRLRDLGLSLLGEGDSIETINPLAARATGPRLHRRSAEGDRAAALADALAIGGGYAELLGGRGGVLKTAGQRLLDLKSGIVGPWRAVPADFSRHQPRGRCPACEGTRTRRTVDISLIVGSPAKPPHEDGFLTSGAESILRGVRRTILVPFLKRLEKEGLWDLSIPFSSLSPSEQQMLFHGYWRRPGHGSFLKSPAEKPEEVASWLRWNGLLAEISEGLRRSKDPAWSNALDRSLRSITCPVCAGTGLRPYADLLPIGGLSFASWAKLRDPRRRIDALRALETRSERQAAARRRLLACLAKLERDGGHRPVLEACVRQFTTADPVWK